MDIHSIELPNWVRERLMHRLEESLCNPFDDYINCSLSNVTVICDGKVHALTSYRLFMYLIGELKAEQAEVQIHQPYTHIPLVRVINYIRQDTSINQFVTEYLLGVNPQ